MITLKHIEYANCDIVEFELDGNKYHTKYLEYDQNPSEYINYMLNLFNVLGLYAKAV